jgi:TorA maturation chaperone TorD
MSKALEILADRGATYALLSQLLREEPSAPFLQGLVNDLATGKEPGAEAGEGYRLLRQFALTVQHASLIQARTELIVEYSRLFLTGRQSGVHPFESVYTSEQGLMMQQARDEVLAAYREEGLVRTDAFNEPEDHLAIELDFMASLCQKTAGELECGRTEAALALLDKQAAFLQEHLLVWVPHFCHDLAQAARSDFYRGVALLVEEHLAQEKATVAEIAGLLGGGQPVSGTVGE